MPERWALYCRQSQTDLEPVATRLERLRTAVETLGGAVELEAFDVAERSSLARPQWLRVRQALSSGTCTALAIHEWPRPFRTIGEWAYGATELLTKVRILVLRDDFDSADLLQLDALSRTLETALAFERRARQESHRLGTLRKLGATEPWAKKAPPVADLEIAALMSQGLSQNAIIQALARQNIRVGKARINAAVHRILAAGTVDREEYTRLRQEQEDKRRQRLERKRRQRRRRDRKKRGRRPSKRGSAR